MARPIVQKGNDVLRTQAAEVPIESITSDEIQEDILSMQEALSTQSDGVALAAPQIALSKRIFVISPKAFKKYTDQPLVYINPTIIKSSKKKEWMDEGCLSVRGLYGKTYRHKQATVSAYNEHGEQFTLGGSGLLAQIFQHEIDHLDSILFDDHAKDVHEADVEDINRNNNSSN